MWLSSLVTQKNETVFGINVASFDGKMLTVIIHLENFILIGYELIGKQTNTSMTDA